jgi:hypothetical protein
MSDFFDRILAFRAKENSFQSNFLIGTRNPKISTETSSPAKRESIDLAKGVRVSALHLRFWNIF